MRSPHPRLHIEGDKLSLEPGLSEDDSWSAVASSAPRSSAGRTRTCSSAACMRYVEAGRARWEVRGDERRGGAVGVA